MNIYVYLYDDFAEFETVFVTTFLKSETIIFTAQENRPYKGEGAFKCLPDIQLKDVNPEEVDLFFIPGGDYKISRKDGDLGSLLQALHGKQKLIVGICGGAFIMADHGLLEGRACTGNGMGINLEKEDERKLFANSTVQQEGIVADGHVITSTGQSYLEIACELEIRLGITSRDQMKNDYSFWKNRNSAWEKNLYS